MSLRVRLSPRLMSNEYDPSNEYDMILCKLVPLPTPKHSNSAYSYVGHSVYCSLCHNAFRSHILLIEIPNVCVEEFKNVLIPISFLS